MTALPDAGPITDLEWYSAQAAPPAIIAGHLYADVGVFVAPGGTGKTTWLLFMAVCIVLGRTLCGMPILKPGWVLILTAEDSREILVARLRAICAEMNLRVSETQCVMAGVRIMDASGSGLRLTEIERDVVRPSAGVIQKIIEVCAPLKPSLIAIDPAVSFGVGESRVNEAEQGLIEAGRRLRKSLSCCVLFVHHTGKVNGREKALDQYAYRGGSAFADGSRMVHVLQPLTRSEFATETGTVLNAGETGLVLARPKMSYCPAQEPLFIRRTGYRFDHVEPKGDRREAKLKQDDECVLSFLETELREGRKHSRNSLSDAGLGLKRAELRSAISRLEASGRLIEVPNNVGGRGGLRHFLEPHREEQSDTANLDIGSPPPKGIEHPANQSRPVSLFEPIGSPEDASANQAKQSLSPPSPSLFDELGSAH